MKKTFITVLALAGLVSPANAVLIDDTANWANETLVDFSQFTLDRQYVPAAGLYVGTDVHFNVTDHRSSLWNCLYGLWTNGVWNADRQGFAGSWGADEFIFTFDTSVKAVGAFMNYTPSGQIKMKALDENFQVLETYNVAVDTPYATNEGKFWGIERDQADIKAISLFGYNSFVVDDFRYTRDINPGPAPVPEPGTMLLFSTGLIGLATLRRKYK